VQADHVHTTLGEKLAVIVHLLIGQSCPGDDRPEADRLPVSPDEAVPIRAETDEACCSGLLFIQKPQIEQRVGSERVFIRRKAPGFAEVWFGWGQRRVGLCVTAAGGNREQAGQEQGEVSHV
jgi:hypothetical protein